MTPIRAAGTLDLTVHLRDPDVEPKMRPARGDDARYRTLYDPLNGNALDMRARVREWEGHAGATMCGKRLELDELWVDHAPEPNDSLCPACFDGEPVDDDPDLWTDDPLDAWPERRVETVDVVGRML